MHQFDLIDLKFYTFISFFYRLNGYINFQLLNHIIQGQIQEYFKGF